MAEPQWFLRGLHKLEPQGSYVRFRPFSAGSGLPNLCKRDSCAYTDTNINCNSNTDSDHSVLFGNEPALRLQCFYPAYNVRYQRALWSQSGNCPGERFNGERNPCGHLYTNQR